MKCQILFAQLLAALFLFSTPAFAGESVMPEYEPKKVITSSLSSVGSDNMEDLLKRWVGAYSSLQPQSNMRIQSRGSASAPPALIDGASDIGPMSREIKESERNEFLVRLGFEPTEINTASVALGVYVSESNPVSEISFDTLERIYSSQPKRSAVKTRLRRWSDVAPNFPKTVISILQTNSEQQDNMFRQKVLSQVAYSKNVKKDLGKEAALKLARMNSGAILIAPLYAEVPQGLKLLEVKELAGGPAVLPSAGIDEYPLSRYLNIYIAREPGREIEESLSDFLTFILSRQGQELVAETGLTPLTVDEVLAQRGKLL